MRKQYTRVQYNKDGLKQCTKCQNYKETSDFHKFSKAQDGLKPWCKVCVREYDLAEDDPKRIMPRKLQGEKIHCRKCERYLDKTDFPKLRKNGKYLTYTYCIECDNLIGHIGNLKNYGLTRDDYVNMEKSQNGVCKICGEPEKYKKRLSVDHDHACCSGSKSCGKCIRGLLCSNCNRVLGQVNDNVETLQTMIEYLNGNIR
jgi:Recombination endonuclease VII